MSTEEFLKGVEQEESASRQRQFESHETTASALAERELATTQHESSAAQQEPPATEQEPLAAHDQHHESSAAQQEPPATEQEPLAAHDQHHESSAAQQEPPATEQEPLAAHDQHHESSAAQQEPPATEQEPLAAHDQHHESSAAQQEPPATEQEPLAAHDQHHESSAAQQEPPATEQEPLVAHDQHHLADEAIVSNSAPPSQELYIPKSRQPRRHTPRIRDWIPGHATLEFTICEALLNKNYGFVKMDPYCNVRIGNSAIKTTVHRNGFTNPIWNETFVRENLSPSIKCLYFEIFDKQTYGSDNLIAWGVHELQDDIYDCN
eukprot:Em0004g1112a